MPRVRIYDMTPHEQDDIALVAKAREGDFAAFESLVNRHTDAVYRRGFRVTARAEDAEEVVQQTFLSILQHLADFRGDAPFVNWALRIATNQALEVLRRRRRNPTVTLADDANRHDDGLPHPEFVAPWRETPEQLAQRHEVRSLVHAAVAELDEKHRRVFLLRDVEGLSTAETAEALHISEANVKVRLLRARLMLRERLTRQLGEEAMNSRQ